MGMQHFHDSFALVSQICVHRDALTLFGLNDPEKVPAEVIQVASYEVDTDSEKDESIVATSGSEESESASEPEQNDPLRWPLMHSMSACKPPMLGRDFKDQENFIGSE